MRVALLLAAGATALAMAPAARAQTMPNNGAWLNSMIGMQMGMQGYGNQQVNRIYNDCLRYPAACRGANPYAAQGAINRLANQYQYNQWAQQQNMWRNWQTNEDTSHAIMGDTKMWTPGFGAWWYHSGAPTLTGR